MQESKDPHSLRRSFYLICEARQPPAWWKQKPDGHKSPRGRSNWEYSNEVRANTAAVLRARWRSEDPLVKTTQATSQPHYLWRRPRPPPLGLQFTTASKSGEGEIL